MSDLFGDVLNTNLVSGSECSLQQKAEEEIGRFKAEPRISPENNPLELWKSHEHKYPHLSFFAKCVLAIPGTSVPCERIFSTAGELVMLRGHAFFLII